MYFFFPLKSDFSFLFFLFFLLFCHSFFLPLAIESGPQNWSIFLVPLSFWTLRQGLPKLLNWPGGVWICNSSVLNQLECWDYRPVLPYLPRFFCYLLTNLELWKCVFSLWLFCPPLNVFLVKSVFSQTTAVPDKTTSHYYLTRKTLQTLKIDKTENVKLSTCLFPFLISGFMPINISLQLSQKGIM